MKLSKKEIAALVRIEREKAFHGDSLILAKVYRQLETEYEKLKRATEAFTAEDARNDADGKLWLLNCGDHTVAPKDMPEDYQKLIAYADILEKEK